MAQTPQSPKGTRDFYPEDQAIQNHIFDHWKSACLRFGYEEYEAPMFEHLELYTGKSGDEIVSQLYNFTDKGDRNIALRPEMTPSLARLVIQKGSALRKPFKWFSMPRLFRYERAQKGRLREFFQLNMDILGTESLNAEVDLLLAICHLLESFGLKEGDFEIGVNNRRLLQAILDQRQIQDAMPVYQAFDKRAKVKPEEFAKLLADAGLKQDDIEFLSQFMNSSSLAEIKTFCQSPEALSSLEELEFVLTSLENLGYKNTVRLDLNIVRGLAYYTGIVFEVFDASKSMRAVAGGGRYDNLCATLGGQSVTGVGFGMGDVVLKDLLTEKGLIPTQFPSALDYYIVSFDDNFAKMFALANTLRQKGFKVSHNLVIQKFNKQLENANKSGAKNVIFLGSDKVSVTQIEVKNLLSGEQSIIELDSL